MSVRLIVEDGSFRRSQKGAVFGSIWFETETICFPGRGWSDLAPAFVRAWLAGLLNLFSGVATNEAVSFMDGPYTVELLASGGSTLEMRFVRSESAHDTLAFSTTAETRVVLQDAVGAGERVLNVYRQMDWSDKDEAAIREAISRAGEMLSAA